MKPAADPIAHLYERFLARLDGRLRSRRGVYFTPPAVASYVARAVHEALQRDLGLADGLASTDTWGDVIERSPGLTLPRGVTAGEPFVRILDPAAGTGVLLLACIDVIERTMKERWQRELGTVDSNASPVLARWNDYVQRHLIPGLHGCELLAAPRALSHHSLSLKLAETGYRPAQTPRFLLAHANALDLLRVAERGNTAALSDEARAVALGLRCRAFTVVVANPPYAKSSANRGPFAEALVRDYKRRVAGEANVQPLSDDYIKFLAFAERAAPPAASVAGLVTNRSFLDGLIHRGLRESMLERCSRIEITDLHGDTKVGEAAPPGMRNDNVFKITQGVCVSLLVRGPAVAGAEGPAALAKVSLGDVWGTREEKGAALSMGPLHREIVPRPPGFFFSGRELSRAPEVARWPSLPELFRVHGMGVKSRRDHFLIAHTREELVARLRPLLGRRGLEALRDELGVTDNARWSLARARRVIRRVGLEEGIAPILYRPFDTRFIYYDREIIERGDARWPLMRHVVRGGVSLLSSRQSRGASFSSAFVATGLSEMKAAERSRGSVAFPLHLASDAGPASNLRAERLGGAVACLSPEEALAYIYAILWSPSYRRRYLEELRVDFPRIPPCESAPLVAALSRSGARLMSLHLLSGPVNSPASFFGERGVTVSRVGHQEGVVWLNGERTAGFRGVGEEVWGFEVGGYRVCERWLKERRGRPLSKEDVAHVERMVGAIAATVGWMREIDEVIEAAGGWPEAFT